MNVEEFKNYIINNFSMRFIKHSKGVSDVFLFDKNNLNYEFYLFEEKETKIQYISIKLTSYCDLHLNELLNIFTPLGYEIKSHKYIESFFTIMEEYGFSDSHTISKYSKVNTLFQFNKSKKNDDMTYMIKNYNYGKVFYNNSVKEKNETKLALSSSIEVRPAFYIRDNEIQLTELIKLPFTFKNKLFYRIPPETDIVSFEIYVRDTIKEILRKKLVSSKILKKEDSVNLSIEDLLALKPYLEMLNY